MHGRPIALVPAAGASRRMGAPKLLLPFAGGTLLGSTVAALRAGGCARVLVVTAPADQELRDWVAREGLEHAVNSEPERGMLTTLWAGIAALFGDHGAASPLLVSPGDLPRLEPSTVRAVLAALTPPTVLAWPRSAGRNGHPLAVAASVVPEILTLDPTVGLRQLRERHGSDVVAIDVDDPGCVEDVDTPADYRALLD